MKRHSVTAIALITLSGLAGCGNSDSAASDATAETSAAITTNPPATTPAEAPATTSPEGTSPEGTAPQGTSSDDTVADSAAAETIGIAEFCAAKVAFDAVNSDTPDEESFDVYVAEATARADDIVSTAPAELQRAATTVLTTLRQLDDLEEGTVAHADVPYAEAREELARGVHELCRFGQISIGIAANTFSSVTVAAIDGVTSVLVDNTDPFVHVTIIAKLVDGISADQLLADPELFETSATVVGVIVAGPQVADGAALALPAGNYVYFDPEHVQTGMAGAFTVPS